MSPSKPLACVVLLAALAFPAGAQGPTLVAHYKLDDTSGTTLAESSGQGADATLAGTYLLGLPGAAPGTGTAVSFDPAGLGMAIVPDGPNLTDLRNDLTLTAWVHPLSHDPSFATRIFSGDDSAWSAGMRSQGLRFTTRFILDYDLNGPVVPLNTWTHLAYVMDASDDVTFYVDGVNMGTVVGSSPSQAPTGSWLIAAFRNAGTPHECFDGALDDIQIYSGSLSDADIAALFASPGTTLGFGASFCTGDGSGTVCPCGNSGAAGHGCGNGTFAAGARIEAGGGLTAVVLDLAQAASGQATVFFQGNNALNGGAGILFGDGLRCVGGSVIRLSTQITDAGGSALMAGTVQQNGGGGAPGETRYYQAWYADPSGSPCGQAFNLSNAVRVDY